MLMTMRARTAIRPTSMSSMSEAFLRTLFHTSMVKMVEMELKTEVREEMRADIITASIRPRTPAGISCRQHG